MKILAALLFALPLAAQLQVLFVQGDSQVPVGASLNLGLVSTGDSAEFRFRARNAGTAAIPLETITAGGAAFSLVTPLAPLTLAPSQSHDFLVRFSPVAIGSYSAVLTVNSFSTVLRAAAAPGPSLFLSRGSQTVELTASSMQIEVAAGQPFTIALSAGNPHATPLTITQLSLAGAGFTLATPPSVPFTLAPGETRPIPVNIAGSAEGEIAALLTVGARRFSIVAVVFRPQLMPPAILTSEAVPRNGQQLKVRLQLALPAPGPGSGTLRATFTGASDDPAIVFPNGRREIDFEVVAGSRDATFGGAPETVLQTGTTAGVLRLDALTESGIVTETYRFERGAVVVEAAAARRTGSTLEIDITGFDNTRGLGSINFRFFDRAGNPLGGVITTTPAEQFRAFFDQSGAGGVFRLTAAFPVTGDATIVGSVLVEVANAVGRTDLPRLSFP